MPLIPLALGKAFYDAYKGSQATEGANKARQDQMVQNLNNQGGMSSWFADQAQGGYGSTGVEAQQAREHLRRLASGQDSLSREQLRQGVQQNRAAQQSFAASAAPRDAAMAGIMGANNMGRANYGMSGQAAMAGIAERQGAANALNQAILGARGQDLQAALGSRQNAINAYGGTGTPSANPDEKQMDRILGIIQGGLGAMTTMSDKRLKKDIEDGDSEASKALKGLRAYSYRYKDERHGKGRRVGIMAQDLEKAGLGHAVIETPEGKAIHGGHLSTANTALISALEKRVAKIEGRK
jgi:hypothetical protein